LKIVPSSRREEIGPSAVGDNQRIKLAEMSICAANLHRQMLRALNGYTHSFIKTLQHFNALLFVDTPTGKRCTAPVQPNDEASHRPSGTDMAEFTSLDGYMEFQRNVRWKTLYVHDEATRHPKAKGPVYKGGHSYQHPTNKALIWKAKGQKPNWVRELETQGIKPVELP
jgi:hypothetical protein